MKEIEFLTDFIPRLEVTGTRKAKNKGKTHINCAMWASSDFNKLFPDGEVPIFRAIIKVKYPIKRKTQTGIACDIYRPSDQHHCGTFGIHLKDFIPLIKKHNYDGEVRANFTFVKRGVCLFIAEHA